MNKALLWLADLVFPNRCPFCSGKHPCECSTGEFLYDGCAVARPYAETVRKGILELKYRCGFNAAKYLAPELRDILSENGYLCEASLMTAVPMSAPRKRETGYNQAETVAKELAAFCGIKCDFRLLEKKNTSPVQHELSAEERKSAAFGSYSAKGGHADISGKTVILCDDIITTGSTLSACAGALKSMGAAKVYCAVLAGTPLGGKT